MKNAHTRSNRNFRGLLALLIVFLLLPGCTGSGAGGEGVSRRELTSAVLPGLEQLPAGLYLDGGGSRTNEETAQYYPDPEIMLHSFKLWGRVVSYWSNFLNRDGCGSAGGWRRVAVQAVLYETAAGAQAGFQAFKILDEQEEGFSPLEWDNEAGEEGYALLVTGANECSPQEEILGVTIGFRRQNVNAEVYVEGVKDSLGQAELLNQAVALAQIMDKNIMTLAK
jgi:hypothetical protein